jgi:hypothetical protein
MLALGRSFSGRGEVLLEGRSGKQEFAATSDVELRCTDHYCIRLAHLNSV